MSLEDSLFQAYILTAPAFGFGAIAIESDNTTIAKMVELI